MNKDKLKSLFVKICVNSYPAMQSIDGRPVTHLYRREDLSKWAAEAVARGDSAFYCEPVDPNNPNGPLRLCDPKYEYKMVRPLTQEEYDDYFETEKEYEDEMEM